MAIKKDDILNRYTFVVGFVFLIAVAILYQASKTIFSEGQMWKQFGAGLKVPDIVVKPDRGNIYSSDGQLMASSIPQYYIYMDMKAHGMALDSLKAHVDELSVALSKKFKERTPAGYRDYILRNYNKTRELQLTQSRVSFLDFKEVCKFPYLKLGWNLSYKRMVQRKKPFGSLASRTIGDIYGDEARGGKNGLELAYDSLLVGKPGKTTRTRVRGRWVNVNEIDPEPGVDVVSTIDIRLQDIAETALIDKLVDIDAESGVVILMEVKSGKVRACVNMDRVSSGVYTEKQNRAVADEGEPGSTFKVASMMVALDDGVVSPNDTVDTGNGLYNFYGSQMRDHNANKGGYHKITAAQAIWYSSNVGVSRIIDRHYHKNPEKFVDGLYKIGLNEKMNIEIPGAGRPKIRYPNEKNWYATALPWMSIGYEVNIPPIYTLAFFNAIANDGKMIRPYFVEALKKDGEIYEKFSTETIRSSICKKTTLKAIQEMLQGVVDSGTAKVVHSDYVKIAGKTGTAQISYGAGGYTSGGKQHQVTFCGYFPADDPVYTCICQIRRPRNGYPSGGTMSGAVVRSIAEQAYARMLRIEPEDEPRDTARIYAPKIKGGWAQDVDYVMEKLDLEHEELDNEDAEWVKVERNGETLSMHPVKTIDNLVPNVVGMCAKDAVYLLEKTGLNVIINGKGTVYKQSVQGGAVAKRGTTVSLYLK